MFPSFSRQNTPNAMLAHAKLLCELSLGKLGGSNFFDISFAKLGGIVLFAFFVICAVSAFVHHIFHIVGMSAHRKMFRVYTDGIVARMHDFHSFWNPFLMMKHPGNSIGQVHFSPVRDSEKSLAYLVFSRRPQPAIIRQRLLNFNPKTFFKSFIKHEDYIHMLGNDFKHKFSPRLRYA